MKRRVRKPRIDIKEQIYLFKKYHEQLQKTNLKYNDPIFSTISKEIDAKMSPKALFMSFKRNYDKITSLELEPITSEDTSPIHKRSINTSPIVDELRETSEDKSVIPSPSTDTLTQIIHKRSINTSPIVDEIRETSEDKSVIPSPSTDTLTQILDEAKIDSNGQCKIFSFDLDVYELKRITPLYSRRQKSDGTYQRYKTLPKLQWSNMIKEKIWLNSKLRCTWTLKKSKVKDNTFNFKGHCSQCGACIEISSLKKTEKVQTFLCNVRNLIKYKHNKKSRLTTYKRKQLAKQLKYKPAILVRHELASKLISNNDNVEPPVLPSICTLRKIKSDAELGDLFDSNPLISLMTLAKASEFSNSIREICVHPNLHVYYWTDKQIEYFKMYYHKFERVSITIDATGSFFEPIRLPDGTTITKTLFLYAGLITANEKLKSVPIFQMVSDSHNHKSLLKWLKNWLSYINVIPHEVITDDSSALLSANAQAFTPYISVKEYIQNLFSVLEGEVTNLPATFIRLDTSHFIKTLYNLSCFNDKIDSNIKYFYIRCINLLKKCEDYETAKQIIQDIVKICLGQCHDDDEFDKSEAKEAKDRLDRLHNEATDITTDKKEIEKASFEKDISDEKELNKLDDTIFFTWFDQMVESNKSSDILENANKYYYPPFISTLRRLLYKLPLWSNLLCSSFMSKNKSPSSSAVESNFKTLKTLIFKTKIKRHRIDQFLKIHLEYLDGEMKIAVGDLCQDKVNKKPPASTRSRKRKNCKQNPNTQRKRTKIPKCDTDQRFPLDSIFCDEPSFYENWRGKVQMTKPKSKVDVKFLKNGNLCSYISTDGKNRIKLTNTCALDSVIYLLALGYCTNNNVKDYIDLFKDIPVTEYIKCLTDKDTNQDVLILRARIALQHFKNQNVEDDYINVDCACNVSFIFENLLINSVVSATFTKKCLNKSCNKPKIVRKTSFLPINIDMLSIFGISSLEDAICITNETLECKWCQNQTIVTNEISNFISFDLNGVEHVTLKDIPKTIFIRNRQYKLVGAIEFVPGMDPNNLGHYKGHGYINNKMVCYDDLAEAMYNSKVGPIILHSLSYGLLDEENK